MKIEGFAGGAAANVLINLLQRNPRKNLDWILQVAERIPSNEAHKAQIGAARDWLLRTPSGYEFLERAFGQINRRCLVTIVKNLLVGAAWLASSKRQDFERCQGFYPPFFVTISPIERCNLRCSGCYAGLYEMEADMPWELFDRIICEGKEMGMYFFTISGGEPFMWPHLFQAARKHPDVQFHIYTNGTLIAPENQDIARKIHGDYLDGSVAETIAGLGNMNVSISVEGLARRTNARRGTFRKIPVWDLIISAMGALRKEGCLFAYSVTETQENIEEIHPPQFVEGKTNVHPFIDTMIENGCLLGWHFTFIPCGKDATTDSMCTPAQRDRARRGILRIRATKPIIPLHFWNDGHLVGGCMAGGRLYCHILPDGRTEPCVFAHFAVDNIREKSLKEVLNSPFFRAIRARQPFNGGNHLRPCMIIDAPNVLRELVAQYGARPTHKGAENIIYNLADALDRYAREYGKFAGPAWKEGYCWVKSGEVGLPR